MLSSAHYSTRMGDLYIAPFVRNGTTEQWNDVTGGGGLLSLNFIIINHISRPYVFSELNHIEYPPIYRFLGVS